MDTNRHSDTIVIPALGRPLHPGTLYDCRSDTFIPGITLWDKATLRNCLSSHRQPNTDTHFSASNTLNEKTKLLNVSAGLKASILGGLVDVAGSARYLNDNKSSAQQSQVCLQYSHTTKTEKLTMKQLRNVTYPQVFEDRSATHVVTEVLYGGQAFMMFEVETSEDVDKEEIEGNLNVMVRKIPTVSVEGGGALKMSDNEKILSDNIRCKFYGDFDLEVNPTTYLDALNVYKALPSMLRDKENDAVPIMVWLYPLNLLNKNAAILQKEIQTRLITKAEDVLEELTKAELVCNDMIANTTVNEFPDVKLRLKTFQNMLLNYKVMFLKAMHNLIPAIRGGTKEEKELADIIQIHHQSPFRDEKLNQWLEDNQSELNLLTLYTRQVSEVPVVKYSALYSNILIDPNVDTVVCFCFTSLKNEDPYLLSLTKYLAVDEFEKLSAITESEDSEYLDWFQMRDVVEKARENHTLFRNFYEANKDDTRMRFVIVSFSDPSNLGTCIQLYRTGKLLEGTFQPVSKPPMPKLEVQNQNLILTLQKSPTGTTIKFIVEYMIIRVTDSAADEKWEIIETPDATEKFLLPGFEPTSQFWIRYRAVSEVGVSEVSDSALYAPKGIYRFSLGQSWNSIQESLVNELRTKMLGNLGTSWLNPSTVMSEVTNRVNNPKIPYVGAIPGYRYAKIGMGFYLQGVVSEKLGEIAFCLKNGQKKYDDMPFQLFMKPTEYCLVAAQRIGAGGATMCHGCPLFKGSTFAVIIAIEKEGYEVYLNSRRVCFFEHVLAMGSVNTLYIHGDFIVNTVGTIPNWSTSIFAREQRSGISGWELSNIQSDLTYPVCKPNQPYLGTIPGGLKTGMALFFQGVVPLGSKGFEISQMTGPKTDDDVAFLFKSYLNSVFFNSCSNGKWNKEAYIEKGALPEGEAFDIVMLIVPAHICIIINGIRLRLFEEQIPGSQVSTIKISGDVFMNTFGIANVDNANMMFEMTSLN